MPLPDANPPFLEAVSAEYRSGHRGGSGNGRGPYAVMLLWRLREYAGLLAEAVGREPIPLPFIARGLLCGI